MKKIGILTFHWADNYGAVLQAYALQTYLSKIGYNVEVVNYKCKYSARIYSPFYFESNSVSQSIKGMIRCIYNFPNWVLRRYAFNKFRKRIIFSNHTYTKQELLNEQYDYAVFITGSDQVWNTEIVGDDIDVYALSFVKKASAISYAASSGTIDTQYNEKDRNFVNGLKKLDAISVREKSTKEYLEINIKKPIFLSADPTMLLTRKDWENIGKNVNEIGEKYLFVYCISYDKQLIETVKKVSREKKLKIVVCGKIKELNKEATQFTHASPNQFINLVKYADFIVATSYHATVFATIFKKQFLVLLPSYASNRISDFCETFGLQNRCIYDVSEIDIILKKEIAYDEVVNKMMDIVSKSKSYLKKALEEI